MSLNSQLLRLKAGLLLKDGEPKPPVLVFTSTRKGNLALGNLIQMLPMLKAVDLKCVSSIATFVCDSTELEYLLWFNFKNSIIINLESLPHWEYNTSISNFLCQDKETVKKIIELRIPCRIGHLWEGRSKYRWLYTHVRLANEDIPEEYANNQLVDPFGLCPQPYQLRLPPVDIKLPKYDILFQVHSSGNPAKDYPRYGEVINILKKEYKIGLIGSDAEREYSEKFADKKVENLCGLYSLTESFHLLNSAELVVGNDSGLLKVSDNLGIPSIQIFRQWSPCTIRCAIKQTNLIDPSPKALTTIIRNRLHA